MRFHAFRRLAAFTLNERLFRLSEQIGDSKAVKPVRLNCFLLEDRVVPSRPLPKPELFIGSGHGDAPAVRAVDAETGSVTFETQPYGSTFSGGQSVASADFNNDGVPDVVVGAGKGGGPRVRIFNGKNGQPLVSPIGDFFAYDSTFTAGIDVAAGDLNGDGFMDVVTTPGAGGGPRVRAFSGKDGSVLADFFAFDATFTGGVHIATGDFNVDGKDEILVAAGPGGGPRLTLFGMDGKTVPNKLSDFFAFDSTDRLGVFVATGDVNGDGLLDVIAGSGAGRASEVRVFNGRDGSMMADRAAFAGTDVSGVRVASAYVNDDGYADVVVANGPGSAGTVKVFAGGTGTLAGTPVDSLDPFADAGGVMIAAANDPGTESVSISSITVNPDNKVVPGQAFPISVRVVPDSVTTTPTGTVQFYAKISGSSDLIPLGSADLGADPIGGDYGASAKLLADCTVLLPSTDYDITADYIGDDTYDEVVETASSAVKVQSGYGLPQPTPSDGSSCSCSTTIQPAPSSSGNAPSEKTASGILAVDGSITISRTDFTSDGFGTPWGSGWAWTNADGFGGDATGGTGSVMSSVPRLVMNGANTNSLAVLQGTSTLFYDYYDGGYHARYSDQTHLAYDATNSVYVLTDGKGSTFHFDRFHSDPRDGRLLLVNDANNNATTLTWSSGKLTTVARSDSGTDESLDYTYFTSGENAGMIANVSWSRERNEGGSTVVRSADYSYFGSSSSHGLLNDLKSVVVKDGDGNAIDTTNYRYYTGSSSGSGYAHGLKYVFGPEASERAAADLSVATSAFDSLTDTQVDGYSDHFFTYDSSHRVTAHRAAGAGCSVCTGGQGNYTYAYDEVDHDHGTFGGMNVWRYKVTETLPDGNKVSVR